MNLVGLLEQTLRLCSDSRGHLGAQWFHPRLRRSCVEPLAVLPHSLLSCQTLQKVEFQQAKSLDRVSFSRPYSMQVPELFVVLQALNEVRSDHSHSHWPIAMHLATL